MKINDKVILTDTGQEATVVAIDEQAGFVQVFFTFLYDYSIWVSVDDVQLQ